MSRTGHYELLGYLARQEQCNPVDELLDAAARDVDGHPTPQRGGIDQTAAAIAGEGASSFSLMRSASCMVAS